MINVFLLADFGLLIREINPAARAAAQRTGSVAVVGRRAVNHRTWNYAFVLHQVAHLQATGKVRRVPMNGFDEWTDSEVRHLGSIPGMENSRYLQSAVRRRCSKTRLSRQGL